MKKIHLSIPKPCHENWDRMTLADKGKYCGSCQKVVTDFTTMSDREIIQFFKKPTGSVCGRFNQEQLERDINIPGKRIPWIRYFFQISLPAFLFSMKAQAQMGIPINKVDTLQVPGKKVEISTSKKPSFIQVKGKITDVNDNPIQGASIRVTGSKNAVTSDVNGFYQVSSPPGGWIEISAVGYESVRKRANRSKSNMNIVMNIILDVMIRGEVVVTTGMYVRKTTPDPLIKKLADSISRKLSIHPNPASTMSMLRINSKKLEKGDYVISLLSVSGEVLQTEDVRIEKKQSEVSFQLHNIPAGAYLVHVFNRRTAASYSENLVVQ